MRRAVGFLQDQELNVTWTVTSAATSLETCRARCIGEYRRRPGNQDSGDARVIGGVAAIELVEDKASEKADGYFDQLGPVLTEEFPRRGLLLQPLGNVIYFMAPYVITEAETDWVMDQIYEGLQG